MADVVGRLHDFADPEYARDWTARFSPTPERAELFRLIVERLLRNGVLPPRVVELGVGPGFLASHILRELPDVSYVALDSSRPMLAIARRTLREFADRLTLVRADLVADDWVSAVGGEAGAVVSTWTLHDLGSEEHITQVYRRCERLLSAGGVLINGDFIKPERTAFEFEPGRLTVTRHLGLLREAGLRRSVCLAYFEPEEERPTPSTNYACFEARR